jgi:hypothetical protein
MEERGFTRRKVTTAGAFRTGRHRARPESPRSRKHHDPAPTGATATSFGSPAPRADRLRSGS